MQTLGITHVGQLADFTSEDLVARFGATTGAFLAALPSAQDDTPVRDRGPQKSIMAERSFPPLQSVAAIESALQPLAASLLQRLAQVHQGPPQPPPPPPPRRFPHHIHAHPDSSATVGGLDAASSG